VCPKCNEHLESSPDMLVCRSCKLHWLVKEDIPDFSSYPLIPHYRNSVKEAKNILYSSQRIGWQSALYNYNKNLVNNGLLINEDIRIADWRFNLPLEHSNNVLIIGCGMGILPISLLKNNQKVYVVDSIWERLAFLKMRSPDYDYKNNLTLVKGDNISMLPFKDNYFDTVIISFSTYFNYKDNSFKSILEKLDKLLKQGGHIHISIDNTLSLNSLISTFRDSKGVTSGSFYNLRNILNANKFSNIRIFAPLPHHNRIPLFSIPLDNNYAIRYFFLKIFPLFDMVTPEAKKSYGFSFIIIKFIVRLSLLLRFTSLAKIFVPGFSIIAKK